MWGDREREIRGRERGQKEREMSREWDRKIGRERYGGQRERGREREMGERVGGGKTKGWGYRDRDGVTER